ncbi:unnamed protein product [Brassica oleracea]
MKKTTQTSFFLLRLLLLIFLVFQARNGLAVFAPVHVKAKSDGENKLRWHVEVLLGEVKLRQ